MRKLLAVIKREYIQRVRSKFFVIMTILGPFMLLVFTVAPGLLFSIKAGGDTRLAIVDQTEGHKLFDSVSWSLKQDEINGYTNAAPLPNANLDRRQQMEQTARALRGGFVLEQVDLRERPIEEVKRELSARIGRNDLDAYVVIPADILENNQSRVSYYGRNVGDVIARGQIEDRLSRAVRTERLRANGIREDQIENLSKPVELDAYGVNDKGEEGGKDTGAGFVLVFVVAFLIYICVLLYGQVILGAVVEEKETRIAEVLLSSVRSLTLMMGKLIGVSLVAVTQLGSWFLAFALLTAYGVNALGQSDINLPHLPASFFVYFFLFFILGYFMYASMYVLIGSMVTTPQEGGQLSVPVVFLLMAGLYLAFPVIRSPNSPFAFWVSMIPFFSPITMIVRIVSQTPPTWQILLSLGIGFTTAVLLVWLSSRIYRIGMLMYGKKATIPEVARWVRQS